MLSIASLKSPVCLSTVAQQGMSCANRHVGTVGNSGKILVEEVGKRLNG